MGNDANIPCLESLKNMYQVAAANLGKARLHKLPMSATLLSCGLQPGDLVLTTAHNAEPFDPKYINPMFGHQLLQHT